MSVSLVVLRLELADGCHPPKDLEFCAPGFQVCSKMSSHSEVSDPSTCSSTRTTSRIPTENDATVTEDEQKLHRGRRELNNLTIETLHRGEARNTQTVDATNKEHMDSCSIDDSQWLGKIGFFSGNPTVETVNGILHIYKNNEMTSLAKGISRSQTICMLGVPAKLACIDLLQFVAPSEEYIEYIKILRDATPNQYMALIKFKDQELADEFYNTYNGQPYNSFEEEVCHLVYVAKVEIMKSSEGASLPCAGLTELPKCPVCLERMSCICIDVIFTTVLSQSQSEDESVEGVLTILCNHSFHGSCLSKWSDSSCPVCRYVQTPEQSSENKCFMCDSTESLWICLICGHVGCGRYASCHAHRHYKDTQHTYSLELGTQRVWDYTGDNYVHRLIQNKTDGKLVEYGPARDQLGDEEKLDSLTLEYTYLLTNQLENQRLYFQEKITRIETEAADQVSSMEARYKKTIEEMQRLEVKLADMEKEKKSVEKKYTQVVSKVGKLVNELKEERELNKCLRDNQKLWHDKVSAMELKLQETETHSKQEVQDLQDQINDLMRHFETQQAISCAPEETRQELQDGHIVLGDASPDKQAKGRRKRR